MSKFRKQKKIYLSDRLWDKCRLFFLLPKSRFRAKDFLPLLPEYKHVSTCRTMVFGTTYYRAWRMPSAGFTGPPNPRSSVLGTAPRFFFLFLSYKSKIEYSLFLMLKNSLYSIPTRKNRQMAIPTFWDYIRKTFHLFGIVFNKHDRISGAHRDAFRAPGAVIEPGLCMKVVNRHPGYASLVSATPSPPRKVGARIACIKNRFSLIDIFILKTQF